ncbi:MAG TPA: efflux RND transporter periplasmic adaptor subunit [Nitrosomonas nitrosa]|uniref:efflux RND transporter periplasmic adaptor subunit n=1 Tax=Nitrosomonas nitrosa TaxID=52442 RepID=UPI0023F90F9D|nr:efflux RND transporter periplasmic adaptor subunit [Nitrosomonas nitrosa]MCO6433358.1 efflux RND transporter periplasmic adaptor subunit [Nitrosomonas nitrosa]HNP52260.1 efflux RND transporter periplasmic adaptor subunit [Nitrosomonas nitrosa]
MIKRIFLVVALTLFIFGGLFGWKYYQDKRAQSRKQAPPPAVVAVTEVKQEWWQPYLTSVGSLVAVAGVDVSNELAGKVTAIQFESGQSVKKGQLLVKLDTSTDEAELKGLQADELLAQVQLKRSKQLLGQQFISQSAYDLNRAQLAQAQSAVTAKQSVISKKHIRAPFDGKLGIRLVDLGQYLAEGSAIVSLQKLDPIYVDFTLPEQYLADLTIGQDLTITVQAYPGKTFHGEISAIHPAIDIGTRSIAIRATIKNLDQVLRPGMFADVQILSSQQKAVLTLPDTAITYNPYGESVFVIKSGEQGLTVQRQQIETGETRTGRVQIVRGLAAGDRVVSAGQVKLRNDMPVTIAELPAPGERE